MMNGRDAARSSSSHNVGLKANRLWLGAAVLVLACAVLAAAGLLMFGLNRSQPSLPRVHVSDPRANDELIAGVPAIVYGRAEDPDGVAQAELWINGQLVATQVNAAGADPFPISQSWRPQDPGLYLLFVRATDSRGHFGQSSSVLVNVRARSAPAEDARSEIPPGADGEAASFVPVVDPPQDTEGPPPEGDYPAVGVPDPPPAPGDGAGRASTPYLPWLGFICRVLPGGCDLSRPGSGGSPPDPEICLFLTGTRDCTGPGRPGVPPPIPPRILASYAGACTVDVSWTDEAVDESGFKLFRLAGESGPALIAVLGGGSTAFADPLPAGGAYRYYVAAFNAQGESPSAPSAEVIVPAADCARSLDGEIAYLGLEALTFTVDEPVDRIYCYYSIGGAPFVRVPADEAEFLEPIEGGWNIAEHAGGRNRLGIPHDRTAALPVAGQCLGWRGYELLDLGSFSQAHPPEEWDGRTLSASPGGYRVEYRIEPVAPETREGDPMAIIDPNIPPPYNLDYGLFSDCSSRGTSGGGCGLEDEGGLQWDWDPPEGVSADWARYKVFFRVGAYTGGPPDREFGTMSGAAPIMQHYYTTTEKRAPAALGFREPCIVNLQNPVSESAALRPEDLIVAEHISYTVQVELPGPAGEYIQSPMSEPREISLSGCPRILAISLNTLFYEPEAGAEWHSIAGGCNPADVYGHVAIGESRLTWNCPFCEDMRRYSASGPPYQPGAPSHDTQLGCGPADEVRFSNEPLDLSSPDRGSSGFAYANNVVLVPIESDYQPVDIRFWFNNYDSGFHGDDNLWCSGGEVYEHYWPAYETLAVRQTRHDNTQDPNCTVVLGVRVLETR